MGGFVRRPRLVGVAAHVNAFLGNAKVRMPYNLVVDHREAYRRRERIGQPDQRAMIEEGVGVARVGGFRKALVRARDRILREPLRVLL